MENFNFNFKQNWRRHKFIDDLKPSRKAIQLWWESLGINNNDNNEDDGAEPSVLIPA